MAAAVTSRYAVLALDEDDDYSNRKKKNSNKKLVEAKPHKTQSIKSDTNFKKKKNVQGQNIKSRNKSTNSNGVVKEKKNAADEQWKEWKKKDTQFIEGNYEDELSQALLLSKLEYEEKNKLYEQKKWNEDQKKNLKKNKKGKVNLSDVQNLETHTNKEGLPVVCNEKGNPKAKEERDVFNRKKGMATEELSTKQTDFKGNRREIISQEALALAQCEDCLEKRDIEINQLKEEIENLKIQLFNVKSRNQKLCQIIANGEMKDKAEVLMEVDRLQTVKDELSSEVQNLHAQLEQERSKVRALTGNEYKSKDKNKRRNLVTVDMT